MKGLMKVALIAFVGLIIVGGLIDGLSNANTTPEEREAKRAESQAALHAAAERKKELEAEREKKLAEQAKLGKWHVSKAISPIDDSQNVTLFLDANNAVEGWLAKYTPNLIIMCRENKTEMYVDVGMSANPELGHYNTHGVTVRLDNQPARNLRTKASTDSKALFFERPIGLVKQLMNHDQMLFRFIPFNASSATTTFDLTGLSEAIKPLRKACHW